MKVNKFIKYVYILTKNVNFMYILIWFAAPFIYTLFLIYVKIVHICSFYVSLKLCHNFKIYIMD